MEALELRAAIVVLAILLAGCIGQPEPAARADAEALTESVIAPVPGSAAPTMENMSALDAPIWHAGDAWSIRTDDGAGNTEDSVLVVSSATADAYMLETTSESMAGYDAMFDVSYLGRIRASDLAGSQHDQPIQFFRFPLADGASWTTTWDGLAVELTATLSPSIATPLGPQPGFTIVGTNGGDPYVEYDFVPALRWWSRIHFAEGYGFTVQGVTANWTGEVVAASANVVYQSASAAPLGGPNSGAFTVAEGQTFLGMAIAGGGSAYARGLALVDPTGTPYMTQTPNADARMNDAFFGYEQLPATPGDWHIASPALHADDGWYSVTIHEVLLGTKAVV